MGRTEETLLVVLRGNSDQNVSFTDLCNVLIWLGFSSRTKGSHHIFFRTGLVEILNL